MSVKFFKCNRCGNIRTVTGHTYTDVCDNVCNECEFPREAPHDINAFGECTLCGYTTHYHGYDDQCDTTCNICGFIRTVIHNYLYDCSTNCDLCGFAREASHVDTDLDTYCDYCNEYRIISDEDSAKIDAFIKFFNDYLNNAPHNQNSILTSNTKFNNVTSSGSMYLRELEDLYSLTIYGNIKEHILSNGVNSYTTYIVTTENGEITIEYVDGKYRVVNITEDHNHDHYALPLLTRADVDVVNGHIEIKSDYMKSLFIAMNNAGMGQYQFDSFSFGYNELIDMFDGVDFVTQIYCTADGVLTGYDIALTNGVTTFYEAKFENNSEKATVTAIYYTGRTIYTKYEYIKGKNGSAKFDLVVTYTDGNIEDLHISTNVTTGLADFVQSQEFNKVLTDAKKQLNNTENIMDKYSGEFTSTDHCPVLVVYDNEYDVHIAFIFTNDKYVFYEAFSSLPETFNVCYATADLSTHKLTAYKHSESEEIFNTLTNKYSGYYTANVNEEAIVIYDNEYNLFVIFVNGTYGYECYGFVETLPENATYVMGTANTVNKTITVN